MTWTASPQVDDDLIAGRDFISADNDVAALDFLDAAFETFDRLAQFPETGSLTRFTNSSLKAMRYCVMPPPFNRWLIFYRVIRRRVEINRVLHGTVNWRQEPERFF